MKKSLQDEFLEATEDMKKLKLLFNLSIAFSFGVVTGTVLLFAINHLA